MVDPLSLTVDACLAAVADAGLTLDDIDGLSTYPGAGGVGHERGRRPRPSRRRSGSIRPGSTVAATCPGPGGAVIAAAWRSPPGLCRHVLCFRTVWESTYADASRARAAPRAGGDRVSGPLREWRAPFGAMSAANWIGMNANQYLHRYGAPREMLGLIAVNGRPNAALQPGRHLPRPDDDGRLPVGTAHHLPVRALRLRRARATDRSPWSSRMRPWPATCPQPAVRIEAVGTQILERVSWDQGTLTHEPQVARPGRPPVDADRRCARPTSTWRWSTTGSPSTPSRGSRRLGFCGFGEA